MIGPNREELSRSVGSTILEVAQIILESFDGGTNVGIDTALESSDLCQTELEILKEFGNVFMGSVSPSGSRGKFGVQQIEAAFKPFKTFVSFLGVTSYVTIHTNSTSIEETPLP